MKDLNRRDIEDSTRDVAPLKAAEDAIELDTTNLSFEEVCQRISGYARG